ncbi:GRAM domain-containing protein 2B [Nematolebias whitei]|uniref:GRAM domain-containing protein 2B n=1 Tax=Nematolebias whitei TaxID=451745 RepID=UPI001899DA06|nr:GRAM domain-containing protein 2B [Nematolebias whitei]
MVENVRAKILWDFKSQFNKQVMANQPDIKVVDKQEKMASQVTNIRNKMHEKLEKYQWLKEEIQKLWRVKESVVIGALSKTNCQYHKIFKEISKEEQLRQSYTCALQKDILYQGRMFVSDHWICFHSKVFGKDTKIAIPVVSVTNVKKTKTAILVPNALVIATANDRYVFVSFLSRENTYKFLMSVCLHLEERSPCSSPVPSSAENSFRGQRSSLSPLFPLRDFSELDGALRQRRQEVEESSSSDSQAPDYDKIADLPVPPFLDALNQNNTSPPEQHSMKKQQNTDSKPHIHHPGSEVVIDSRNIKPISLNTLLVVYLFLVCVLILSSCYLALRIVSLEQRLTTLGSLNEFTHHE